MPEIKGLFHPLAPNKAIENYDPHRMASVVAKGAFSDKARDALRKAWKSNANMVTMDGRSMYIKWYRTPERGNPYVYVHPMDGTHAPCGVFSFDVLEKAPWRDKEDYSGT